MNIAVGGSPNVDVVGDGPAAMVVAILLARCGWSVRLVKPNCEIPTSSITS
jgi:2-polyprenyl-6-methoxyphenol hydroxylase-like FAD-dependent oxidoreductase